MPVLRTKKKIASFEDFEGLQGEEMKPFVAMQGHEAAKGPAPSETAVPSPPEARRRRLPGLWRRLMLKLGITAQQ